MNMTRERRDKLRETVGLLLIISLSAKYSGAAETQGGLTFPLLSVADHKIYL